MAYTEVGLLGIELGDFEPRRAEPAVKPPVCKCWPPLPDTLRSRSLLDSFVGVMRAEFDVMCLRFTGGED